MQTQYHDFHRPPHVSLHLILIFQVLNFHLLFCLDFEIKTSGYLYWLLVLVAMGYMTDNKANRQKEHLTLDNLLYRFDMSTCFFDVFVVAFCSLFGEPIQCTFTSHGHATRTNYLVLLHHITGVKEVMAFGSLLF